jgi:hypothetical protein
VLQLSQGPATCFNGAMFRRSQVDEAVGRVLELESRQLRSEARTRLRRLLDLDRQIGRKKGSNRAENANFAFHSDDGPGKGTENLFSSYESFAILLALQMMQHGWTQGFAVAQLRRLRPELEKQHRQILRWHALLNSAQIERPLKLHFMMPSVTPSVYLVLVSSEGDRHLIRSRICDYETIQSFVRHEGLGQEKGLGRTFTIFPLTTYAQRLHLELLKSEPKKRGRKGSST